MGVAHRRVFVLLYAGEGLSGEELGGSLIAFSYLNLSHNQSLIISFSHQYYIYSLHNYLNLIPFFYPQVI